LASQTQPAGRRVRIERRFNAAIEQVWELWTTKDGIESWWGPDGFQVKVRTLDVRPGGELAYDMTAIAPDQIDFVKKAGMPVTNPSLVTFTEVVPFKRLAFTKPYQVAMTVEFENSPQGVRMVLTLDAMHDEYWTKMAVMGWENELDNLAKLLTPV
jgi:uncharacterized protein YndB with AHSA1/START domain